MALTDEPLSETAEKTVSNTATRKQKVMFWFKRLGWAGFLFFLIKGIIWLFIFWLGAEAVTS